MSEKLLYGLLWLFSLWLLGYFVFLALTSLLIIALLFIAAIRRPDIMALIFIQISHKFLGILAFPISSFANPIIGIEVNILLVAMGAVAASFAKPTR